MGSGMGSGMGGKGGGQCTSLNRRGHAGVGEWQPLVWAAKDNNLAVACKLLDTGTDVNLQEPLEDKGSSGYAALHWAAMRGFKEMISMLLKRGANLDLVDNTGDSALILACSLRHKAMDHGDRAGWAPSPGKTFCGRGVTQVSTGIKSSDLRECRA
jgi:hypothetical protein